MVAVVARLALALRPDRAVERAGRGVGLVLHQVAEAERVGVRRAHVDTRHPEEVLERGRGQRLPDRARRDVARARLHHRVLVAVLGRREPPGLAAHDRAAERRGVLLAVEGRRLARAAVEGGRQALQRVVAQEDGERAAERVGAAARHHVDRGGRRAALLGRVAVRRHLELLHRVLRQVGERTAHHVVVVVLSVDRDVAAAPRLAGRRDRHHVRLGRVEVRRRRVARQQERELQEVAAVQREVLDHAGPDHPAHDRVARRHADAPLLDLDALGPSLQGQYGVDTHAAPHFDDDALDRGRGEAGRFDRDPVLPGWKARDHVAAGRIGRGHASGAGGDACRHDAGPCHGRARRVDHATRHVTRRGVLSAGGGGERRRAQDDGEVWERSVQGGLQGVRASPASCVPRRPHRDHGT